MSLGHGDGDDAGVEVDVPDGVDVETLELFDDVDEELMEQAAEAAREDAISQSQVQQFTGDIRAGTMMPEDSAKLIPELAGRTRNTGPKGVKADYEIAKLNNYSKLLRQKIRHQRQVKRRVQGKEQYVSQSVLDAMKEQQVKERQLGSGDDESSSGSDDSDLEDDDDAMDFAEYKRQRLAALVDEMPEFGVFKRVTKLELAAALQKHHLTVTVVHLYQNYHEGCVRVNLALEDLAPQFPTVQFVRIRSRDAIPTYNDAGLPTLMVYRGEKLMGRFVRLTTQLGTNFSDTQFVNFLARHNILGAPEIAARKVKPKQGIRFQEDKDWSDDDEEDSDD